MWKVERTLYARSADDYPLDARKEQGKSRKRMQGPLRRQYQRERSPGDLLRLSIRSHPSNYFNGEHVDVRQIHHSAKAKLVTLRSSKQTQLPQKALANLIPTAPMLLESVIDGKACLVDVIKQKWQVHEVIV